MWQILDSSDAVVGSFDLTPATEAGIASGVVATLGLPFGVTVHCAASGANWLVWWAAERVTVKAAT